MIGKGLNNSFFTPHAKKQRDRLYLKELISLHLEVALIAAKNYRDTGKVVFLEYMHMFKKHAKVAKDKLQALG